ncbi:TonB-linked SusC/RagA family outer membrane protein [Pedobacter cryoconitis]|uniref:TonB-linked SusC/RagA family outer membrane protein n=2 Tax=Pedobacter cryoconitis TaxID=188932 RepID=A0A327SRH4_9SPHI|nr:TonB-linked SusC/RagA family outer membrane protein [Pedobacter cryoconitis]
MTVLFFSVQVMGQEKTVSGKVTSAEDGLPLPGVTVKIKGTALGVMTNTEGNYSIKARPGEIMVFSFIGSMNQEQVVGPAAILNVSLKQDSKGLIEVAVTAFGVKQQVRGLGYATQNVKAKEIVESNQPNIVNALQGKVAGVQINNSSGAPGSSASINIRGGSSLSGNNQPLFVVDGIPIDNSTPVSQGGLAASAAPASNRAIDINPEDIESITVLKGPAAAGLYGLRAASGAIVITTKKGVSGAGKITYSTNFSFDQVNKLPELQSVYKQGEQGISNTVATGSWGPLLNQGEPVYNNLGDFFKTGFSQTHDVSASGGNEKTTFFASAGLLDQKGIVENTSYKRKSFRLSGDSRISDKLKVGGTMNYVESDRKYVLQGSGNGVMGAALWPTSDNMSIYLNPDGSQRTLTGIDNPYWSRNYKPVTDKINRIIANGNIVYDPFSFLNVTYRLGTDFYNEKFKSIRGAGTTVVGEEKGAISEVASTNQITTSTLLVTGKKTFWDDFNTSLTLGHNLESMAYEGITTTGLGFIDPTFNSTNNTLPNTRTSINTVTRRRIMGVFADLNLDYKNLVYLNFRGRNDWSSTVRKDARSFFYPAISTSVLFSEILKVMGLKSDDQVFSFGKFRASWARVGKDAPPYVLATTLGTTTNSFTINPRGFIINSGAYYGNPLLQPEFTNSFEIGTDIRFFKSRLGLDVTYYNSTSDNQILGTRTTPSSGAFLAYLNGGSINSRGVEAILNIQPVARQNFKWSVDLNFAKNKSTVKSLPGELDRIELSDAWVAAGGANVAQAAAFLNGSLFGINGTTWKTNSEGKLLLDNNGAPQVAPALSIIGDRNPDFTAGITNTFTYKNLSLSFMIDIRRGGDIFNNTENAMVYSGTSKKTLDRTSRVFDGIIESTGLVNTKSINLDQNYYQTLYAKQGYDFVEDGSWYRLRYATISYSFPKTSIKGIGLSNLQVSLTGRNLILITNYSGVDPEVSGSGAGVSGSGSFGFDNLGIPATRGFDLGLRLSF